MSAIEWNEGRSISEDARGRVVGQRVWKVTEHGGTLAGARLQVNLPPTPEFLNIGSSTYPGADNVVLDSLRLDANGAVGILTGLYSSDSTFSRPNQPDPLDAFFRSWQVTFEEVEVEVPSIRLAQYKRNVDDGAGGTMLEFTQAWELGEPVKVKQTRPVVTYRTNRTGLAGTQIVDVADIEYVTEQANRLHELRPGTGQFWRCRPRILRQESETQWVVEHEWVKHNDLPPIVPDQPLTFSVSNPGPNPLRGWIAPGDISGGDPAAGQPGYGVMFPHIQIPGGGPGGADIFSALPAYTQLAIWPDFINGPDITAPPNFTAEFAYVKDATGHLLLPGVTA